MSLELIFFAPAVFPAIVAVGLVSPESAAAHSLRKRGLRTSEQIENALKELKKSLREIRSSVDLSPTRPTTPSLRRGSRFRGPAGASQLRARGSPLLDRQFAIRAVVAPPRGDRV